MAEYYRVNETEKSKALFDLRKFFETQESIVFAYLHGDFLFTHFFKNLQVGIYFDENKISSKKWDSEIDIYSKELADILHYPIEFLIINTAPLELQIDVVKGSLLACTNEGEKTKFLEEILKD